LKYIIAALALALTGCVEYRVAEEPIEPAQEVEPVLRQPSPGVSRACINSQREEIRLGKTQLDSYTECKKQCAELSDDTEQCVLLASQYLDLTYSAQNLFGDR